jgi:hypothetical protein
MTPYSLERDREEARPVRPATAPPRPEAQPPALEWASAVGNQAVQRLARMAAISRAPAEDEGEEMAPEGAAEEASTVAEDELPDELPE